MKNEVMVVEAEVKVEELKSLPDPQKQPLMERLQKLGFKNVVNRADRMLRMKIAYEKFMYVTPSHIQAFNEALKRETLSEDRRAYHYKKLVFIPLEEYNAIPSEQALAALEKAQEMDLFDYYNVAKIDWVEKIKDPIIFGRIKDCEDYFFISQWDNDVSVEEIILGK